MTVLVTGGTGMLGAVLVKRLSKKFPVTAVARHPHDASVAACDLTRSADVEKLFGAARFAGVIHTAAYSDVDGCEADPATAHAANALATRYLASACGRLRVPFVYVSTDYVFNGLKTVPYTEDDRSCPINVYGMTKLSGESYTRALAPVSAVVRTSWLFGPGNPKSFVNAIAARLKKDGAADVLDDQTDSPTSVEDLSDALERVLSSLIESEKKGERRQETFHVCNAGETTRREMTVKIAEGLGLKNARIGRIDASRIPQRLALRPRYAVMSARRYESAFGVKLRSWQDALGDFLKAEAACASS